jgi:hypothetical protein
MMIKAEENVPQGVWALDWLVTNQRQASVNSRNCPTWAECLFPPTKPFFQMSKHHNLQKIKIQHTTYDALSIQRALLLSFSTTQFADMMSVIPSGPGIFLSLIYKSPRNCSQLVILKTPLSHYLFSFIQFTDVLKITAPIHKYQRT